MHENKIKKKVSKCEFAVTRVEYLVYIVKNGTIAMDPEKIFAVVDWPVPILIKQL